MKRSKMLQRALRSQRGMTLLEIMVVIAILGMMATFVSIAVINSAEDAKVDGTKVQMHNVAEALDAYKIKIGNYPSTEEGLDALVQKGIKKKLPMDKWDLPFQYIRNRSRSYSIKSLGADGNPGGEGADTDLEEAQ